VPASTLQEVAVKAELHAEIPGASGTPHLLPLMQRR
jgi:hypothetical protein